jgi:Flp pilus assembly pilin Flp
LLALTKGKKGHSKMINLLRSVWSDDEGQDLIEYALMLVLILLVSVTAIGTIGNKVGAIFNATSTNIPNP